MKIKIIMDELTAAVGMRISPVAPHEEETLEWFNGHTFQGETKLEDGVFVLYLLRVDGGKFRADGTRGK